MGSFFAAPHTGEPLALDGRMESITKMNANQALEISFLLSEELRALRGAKPIFEGQNIAAE